MSISSISSNTYASAGVSRQQKAQERFEAADADKSGALSLEEFQAAGPKDADKAGRGGNRPSAEDMFAKMDSDGDGSLTQTEMETAFQSMRSETKGALLAAQEESGGFGGPGGAGGPPPGGPPPGGPPPGGQQGEESSESGSSSIASLLSSSTSEDEEDEDDPLGTLISQLQTAINSYTQKTSANSSSTSSQAVA